MSDKNEYARVIRDLIEKRLNLEAQIRHIDATILTLREMAGPGLSLPQPQTSRVGPPAKKAPPVKKGSAKKGAAKKGSARAPSADRTPTAWRLTAKGVPRKRAFKAHIPRKNHGAKFFKATFAKMEPEDAIREYFRLVKEPVRAVQIAEELMDHGFESTAKRPSAVISLVLQRMESKGELIYINKEWLPTAWLEAAARKEKANTLSAGRDGGSNREKGRLLPASVADVDLE